MDLLTRVFLFFGVIYYTYSFIQGIIREKNNTVIIILGLYCFTLLALVATVFVVVVVLVITAVSACCSACGWK